MNKKKYRTIFSKVHGFMIPVSEISTVSHGNSAACDIVWTLPTLAIPVRLPVAIKPLAMMLALAMFSSPLYASSTALQPDMNAPVNQRPTILHSPGGATIVNITTPANPNKLSHNKFLQFNADKGLVLNNAVGPANIYTGELISGNPSLANSGKADGILVEVTGPNSSSLKGQLEVAGSSADLMIVNPNGVTLDGVTAVNTSSLTVAAGKVAGTIAGQHLQIAVDDTSGRIIIGDTYLNSSSYFDVVGKGIELNGKIDSNTQITDINAISGTGLFTSGTHDWHPSSSSVGHPVSGNVGISGNAAGSMYGKNITLISTDSGAGVRHMGVIKSENDLTIDSEGDITLVDATAKGDLNIQAGHDITANNLGAGRALTATAGHDLRLEKRPALVERVKAAKELNLIAGNYMQMDSLVTGANTNLRAPDIKVTGKLTTSDLVVDTRTTGGSSGKLELDGSPVILYADTLDHVENGANVERHDGKYQVKQPDGSWREVSSIYSTGFITANGNIKVDTGNFLSHGGGVKSNGGDLILNADSVSSVGMIQGGHSLHLHTTGDFNSSCGLNNEGITFCDGVQSAGEAVLDIGGKFSNAADIMSAGNMNVTLQQIADDTNSGNIFSSGDLTVFGHADLTSTGLISGGNTLSIQLDKLINGGDILSPVISLNANTVQNLTSGKVTSSGALTAQVTDLDNAGSLVGKTVTITGDRLVNSGTGTIAATDTLAITSHSVTNKGSAVIQGNHVTTDATTDIANQDNALIQGENITLTAPKVNNTEHAVVHAAKDLTITTNLLHNSADMQSDDTALLTINPGNTLVIDQNTHTPLAKNMLTIKADDLTLLDKGEISNPGGLAIDVRHTIYNAGGIAAGKAITINTENIINDDNAQIWGMDDITLNTNDITNGHAAGITSQKNLTIVAKDKVINNAGKISAKGDLSVDTPLLENNSEVLGTLNISAPKDHEHGLYYETYVDPLGPDSDNDWNTYLDIPVIQNNIQTGILGIIEAGGELQLNQKGQLGKVAMVHNHGSLISTGNMLIDGNIDNSSGNRRLTFLDMLKDPHSASSMWAVPSDHTSNFEWEEVYFNSMYSLFNYFFHGPFINWEAADYEAVKQQWGIVNVDRKSWFRNDPNDAMQDKFKVGYASKGVNLWKWIKSINDIDNPLLDVVFGADRKNMPEDISAFNEMKKRWDAFVSSSSPAGQNFFGNKIAEIKSGGSITTTGGYYSTAGGATQHMNETVSVSIGGLDPLTTLRPDLDANFNTLDFDSITFDALKNALNPAEILADLAKNKLLFSDSTDNGISGVDDPLYVTRLPYIDPTQYHGADYFFAGLAGKGPTSPTNSGKTPVTQQVMQPSKVTTSPGKNSVTPAQGSFIPPGERLLGDAYFDHEYIINTLEQIAGSIYDGMDENARVDLLMNNAAEESKRLGLTPGEPLTQDQYNQLDRDMVWYEPEVVDGVTVLVPHVYLAHSTLDGMKHDNHNGAQMAANHNITAHSTSVDNLNGVIHAGGHVGILSAGDVNNISSGGVNGSISSGDGSRVTIAAHGEYNNQGSDVYGGDVQTISGQGTHVATDMHITPSSESGHTGELVSSHNGNIYSTGTFIPPASPDKSGASKPSSGSNQQDTHDGPALVDTSKPPVTPQDVDDFFKKYAVEGPLKDTDLGHVSLITNGDLNITGAHIGNGNNGVDFTAVGNISLGDVHEVGSSFDVDVEGGYAWDKTTETSTSHANSVGSEVDSNHLTFHANHDVTVTGSNINTNTSDVGIGGAFKASAGVDQTSEIIQVTEGHFLTGGSASNGVNEASGGYNDATGNTTDSNPSHHAGAQWHLGYEKTVDIFTHETQTNHNSQLNFGDGQVVIAGTADLGGADINKNDQLTPGLAKLTPEELAKLSQEDINNKRKEELDAMTPEEKAAWAAGLHHLNFQAQQINSTKPVDIDNSTFDHFGYFVGVAGNAHSSVADTVGHGLHSADDSNQGQGTNRKHLGGQTAGDITQLAFNDTVGGDIIGFDSTTNSSHGDSSSSSQHQSVFGGNIDMSTTSGDLNLTNTIINGGHIGLHAHGDGSINLTGGESTGSSNSETTTTDNHFSLNGGANPLFGAGVGLAATTSGTHDTTTHTETDYTSSQINGLDIDFTTEHHDLNLNGTAVNGDNVYQDVNHVNVTSQQSVFNTDHKQQGWSVSVGGAMTTHGPTPTGGFNLTGGNDWDHGHHTDMQSGITANNSLSGHVSGDVNLVGGHMVGGTGQNNLIIDGAVNGKDLIDDEDKDGASGGGGLGVTSYGKPQINVNIAWVPSIHDQTTQHATFNVNGGTVTGGEHGTVNHDQNDQTHVDSYSHNSGNVMNLTFDPNVLKSPKESPKETPPEEPQAPRDPEPEGPQAPRDPEPPVPEKPKVETEVDNKHEEPIPIPIPEPLKGGVDDGGRVQNRSYSKELQKIGAELAHTYDAVKYFKEHPVTLELPIGPNGQLKNYTIRNASDLLKLNGMEVISGLPWGGTRKDYLQVEQYYKDGGIDVRLVAFKRNLKGKVNKPPQK